MVDKDDPARRGAELVELFKQVTGATKQGFSKKGGLRSIFIDDLRLSRQAGASSDFTPEERVVQEALMLFVEQMSGVPGVEGVGILALNSKRSSRREFHPVIFNRWVRDTEQEAQAYGLSITYEARLWEVLGREGINTTMATFSVASGESLNDALVRFNREYWHPSGVLPVGLISFPLPSQK